MRRGARRAVRAASFLAAIAAAHAGGTGCDCGATDAAKPCSGTSATRVVGDAAHGTVNFTFSFHCGGAACACGRYLTGDYWVAAQAAGGAAVGAVTVDGAPEPAGPNDGLAVDPSGADHGQGLLPCQPQNYVAALNKAGSLPLQVPGDTSLLRVAAMTSGECRDSDPQDCCTRATSVLTVVSQVPKGCGAGSYRPAWAAGDKRAWDAAADFDLSRLPRSAAVTAAAATGAVGMETFPKAAARWSQPMFDLCGSTGWDPRGQREYGCGDGDAYKAYGPRLAFAMAGSSGGGYGGDLRMWYQDAVLLMLGDAPVAGDKEAALHALVQRGIDLYGQKESAPNVMWQARAGQQEGRKLPILFFAALVTDAAVRARVRSYNVTMFQETGQIGQRNIYGAPVYGDPPPVGAPHPVVQGQDEWEEAYWDGVIGSSCFLGADQAVVQCGQTDGRLSRKYRDPYGVIDGPSSSPGHGYSAVVTAGEVAYSLIMRMMPAVEELEPFADLVHDYAGRVTANGTCDGSWLHGSFGVWAAPDTCAPPTAADQRAGCHPGRDESGCTDYKKLYGPDPNRPGHCIEHKKDPMADGRFGNHAGEVRPMQYWPKLAALLLPCGKPGPTPPPSPPTPAPPPSPPTPAPATPPPAPPAPAPPPPPTPVPAACAAALNGACPGDAGEGAACAACVRAHHSDPPLLAACPTDSTKDKIKYTMLQAWCGTGAL